MFLDHEEILNQEIFKEDAWARKLAKYKWRRSSKKTSRAIQGDVQVLEELITRLSMRSNALDKDFYLGT